MQLFALDKNFFFKFSLRTFLIAKSIFHLWVMWIRENQARWRFSLGWCPVDPGIKFDKNNREFEKQEVAFVAPWEGNFQAKQHLIRIDRCWVLKLPGTWLAVHGDGYVSRRRGRWNYESWALQSMVKLFVTDSMIQFASDSYFHDCDGMLFLTT